MIINAENLILGRFATIAAKKALQGEKVTIVNCEKAIITGEKYRVFSDYKRQRDLGTFKGPFLPRLADRFVRRAIRGMLPYKQDKGRKAYDNIFCYKGVPKNLAGEKMLQPKEASASKLTTQRYVTVGQICKNLGAKE